MRRQCCLGKGTDSAFRLACGLAVVAALAASVVGSLSGCIRVSPYYEIEDCVSRFIDAVVAGDFWAVRELTADRPEGWERAIEAIAPAWYSPEIADVERSGDRALVRVVSEGRASSIGSEASTVRGEAGWIGGEASPIIDEGDWIGYGASSIDDEVSAPSYDAGEVPTRGPGRSEWIIELVRIEGVWLVDLGRTLAPDG